MENSSVPFVSIVIPARNESGSLAVLLQSIADLNWPKDCRELILVDNGSSDGSADILKKAIRDGIVVVQEPRQGSYAARNAGAAVAAGDILTFTDADCSPDQDWLTQGIGYLRRHKLDLVTGKVRQVIGSRRSLCDIVDRSIYLRQEWYAKQGFGATANLMITADAFRCVGGFDGRMQSSGDRLLCEKVRANGLSLGYCDAAVVFHPTRSSFSAMAHKEFRLGFGFGQMARLHPGSRGNRLFAETFLPIRGIRGCLAKRQSDVSCLTLAFALACYGLIRVPFRTFGFLRARIQSPRVWDSCS